MHVLKILIVRYISTKKPTFKGSFEMTEEKELNTLPMNWGLTIEHYLTTQLLVRISTSIDDLHMVVPI